MLDITIIAVGKLKEKYFQTAFAEYEKRLRPYARLKVVGLPSAPFSKSTKAQAKRFEGETIEKYLVKAEKENNPAVVYLLAERGKIFSSPDFASWLVKKQPLILIVGGALGFSDELYEKYPQISLSPLTFPHELARVVLIEQIYRAATILSNKEYNY